MAVSKDAVVVDSSVDDQLYGIPIVLPTHIQIGMEDSLRSYNAMTGKKTLFRDNFPSLGHWFSNDFNREIFRGSPPCIFENEMYGPIAIFLGIYGDFADGHPSSLIDSEIIVGLLNRFVSLAQQPVSERSINDESYQSEKLNPKYPPAIPITSFVGGVILMWWRLGWFHSRHGPSGPIGEVMAIYALFSGVILCIYGSFRIVMWSIQL